MTHKKILGLHAAHRDDIADLVTRRPIPGKHAVRTAVSSTPLVST